MKKNEVDVTILIAVYNEEEGINYCFEEVNKECLKLNKSYEIIFVNDGSKDNSLQLLKQIAEKHNFVKVISLSRNFGQRPALLAGFEHASGKVIINMDADLQDPVSLISDFVNKWEEGYDVVLAQRNVRKGESFFKKYTSTLFNKIFKKVTNTNIPKNCGITRLLSRRVVESILKMPEKNIYLAGATEYVGFKQAVIKFDRDERKFGKTKYNVKKLVTLAVNNILPYTAFPIIFIFGLSLFLGFAGVMMLLVQGIVALCSVKVSGLLWLIATLITLTGLTIFSVSMVGTYVLKTYTEALNRPRFIISEKYNLGDNNE